MVMSLDKVSHIVQSIGVEKSFNVTFVKKDGTHRTFFGCTLDVPPSSSTKDLPVALPVKVTEDGVAKWRSFRTDSVLEITV